MHLKVECVNHFTKTFYLLYFFQQQWLLSQCFKRDSNILSKGTSPIAKEEYKETDHKITH